MYYGEVEAGVEYSLTRTFMFRMNGMPRAQEAQERLLSGWHSVGEVEDEPTCMYWWGAKLTLSRRTSMCSLAKYRSS